MKLHFTGLVVLLLLGSFPATNVDAQQRQTQLRGPKDATDQYSGATYGPIDEQDTLWRIASRYRQNPDLSVYQVMQAIYQLNPQAFEQNNFNLLVDGATLRLPSERYIARIDKARAKQRADKDDAQFTQLAKEPANNIKPTVPLVNQEELSDTRNQIEAKINALDAEQVEKFEALRDQFAMSLNNVEALLKENRKLYDRVEQVNTDLMTLRDQVEGDVQAQMDEQLALQKELLNIVRQEQSQRQAQENSGIMATLSQPASLIIGSGILTLLLAGGLGAWLLKRRDKEAPATTEAVASEIPAAPEPDAEIDDLSTSLTSELAQDDADLSDEELFNDEEMLDDVLSSELEEALDDELDSLSDLDDDMLVPDENIVEEFETGDTELEQDELDSLFDDDDVATSPEPEEFDGIDLSSDDALTDSDDDPSESGDFDSEAANTFSEPVSEDDFTATVEDSAPGSDEQSDTPAEEDIPQAASLPGAVKDDDAKPEISIDDLLEEEQQSIEDKLDINSGHVDESMLEKLDKEVHEQNEELDRLADDILNEIDQLEQMGGLPDVEDDSDDELLETMSTSPSPQSIQNLDELAEGLDDVNLDEIETDEISSEIFDDDIIEKLQDEEGESTTSFNDPIGDELLAELTAEQGEEEQQLNELSDELLAELESGVEIDDDASTELDAAYGSDESSSIDDPLTDELLAELESEIDQASDSDENDDTADTPEQSTEQDETATSSAASDDALEDAESHSAADDTDIERVQSGDIANAEEEDTNNDAAAPEATAVSDEETRNQDDTAPDEAQPDNDESASGHEADDSVDELSTVNEPANAEPADSVSSDNVSEPVDNEVEGTESPNTSDARDTNDKQSVDAGLDEEDDDSENVTAEPDAPAVNNDETEDHFDNAPDEAQPDNDESASDHEADDSVDELSTVNEPANAEPADSVSSDNISEPADNEVEDTESLPIPDKSDTDDEQSSDAAFDEEGEDSEIDITEPDASLISDEETENHEDTVSQDALAENDGSVTVDETGSEPDSLLHNDTVAAEPDNNANAADSDPLDDALAEFDRQFIDDIPSFADSVTSNAPEEPASTPSKRDFDDSVLDVDYDSEAADIDEFSLEQETDGVVPESGSYEINDLKDVPGLDDWLTENKKDSQHLFDELESSEFDELLDEMSPTEDKTTSNVSEDELKLDNPDLDLATLLNDPDLSKSEEDTREEGFLDVDTLLDESMDDDSQFEEMPLDLDVSLSEFSGVSDDVDVIDIDKDAGQSANLDLARVYIEMDDVPSARELLTEVVEKGSDEQQEEARTLLVKLGR